jgi:hypothetical protein
MIVARNVRYYKITVKRGALYCDFGMQCGAMRRTKYGYRIPCIAHTVPSSHSILRFL